MVKKLVGFSFKVDDRPGALASALEIIGKDGFNIEACAAISSEGKGAVCLVTNNPQKTTEAFNKAGIKYELKELIEINVPDKPGELAKITHALGEAKVNISFLFITMRKTVAIAVDNTSEAVTTLQKFSA